MEKDFKCNSRTEILSSVDKLNVHNERGHEGVRDRKNKHFKCNVCDNEFGTGGGLINHMRTHTGERPFKCKVANCGWTFRQETNLTIHIRYKHSDDRPFKCEFPGCLHTAKTSKCLTRHKKVHTTERPFACPNAGCSYRGKWKSDVTRHVECVHIKSKTFACTKCGYQTAYSGKLKIHMRGHSARRDFKCSHPQCTKSFKSSSDLRSHFSNRHEERNMECNHPGCGQKLANATALRKHKRNVHLKKIHVCPNPNCDYSTHLATNLARHMRVHEGSNEKIPCSIQGCDYKGNNSKALEEHIRRHKSLLPCPVLGCGLYVPTKETLKDHVKLHNPLGRPFQCPLCFKYFTSLDLLQRHCAVHTNEKPFQCGHCEYATARQSHIKSHIFSLHANIKFPFVIHLPDDRECLHCKVTLSTAKFLVHSKGHESAVVNA